MVQLLSNDMEMGTTAWLEAAKRPNQLEVVLFLYKVAFI